MIKLDLPSNLEDKIFEIRSESDGRVSKIVSYFPFSESERNQILLALNTPFDGFHSIFTDIISEEEWNRTKEQIKNKFKDELFDVDKVS